MGSQIIACEMLAWMTEWGFLEKGYATFFVHYIEFQL
jgi:hypothetical protein